MRQVYFLFQVLILLNITLFSVTGCKNKDNLEEPKITFLDGPDTPKDTTVVKDPEDTFTVNIGENAGINIPINGRIYWTAPNNFYVSGNPYSVSICDLGKVKGLGYITEIPKKVFTTPLLFNSAIACEPGHGYVVKFERGNTVPPQYVRLYVVKHLYNTYGEIVGEEVKYQYPFEPTTLIVSENTLSFTAQGQPKQIVTIKTNASKLNFFCDTSLITIDTINEQDNIIFYISMRANLDSLSLPRREVIVIQANEQQREIIVKQAPNVMKETYAPYYVGSLYNKNGVTGIVYKVYNNGTPEMIVSLEETSRVWSTIYETTGCYNNGSSNISFITAKDNWESKYLAFKWCDNYNTEGVTGWYLPAKNELNDLYIKRDSVNATLNYYNKTPMSGIYWSSSEDSNSAAWYQDFSNGNQYNTSYNKSEFHKVRAVRRF